MGRLLSSKPAPRSPATPLVSTVGGGPAVRIAAPPNASRYFGAPVATPEAPRNLSSAAAIALNPAAQMAFYPAIAMVMFRMAAMPEFLFFLLGVNIPLLYVFGPLMLVGVAVSGGLGRVFRYNPARLWTGFLVCMAIAAPFSIWVGGSVGRVTGYLKTDYICLLALAGTVTAWKEIRTTFNLMTFSGLMVLLTARLAARPDSTGRLSLDMGFDGTLSNANDLAAQIVLLVPFLLYPVFKPGLNKLFKVVVFGAVFYGLWVIIGTGSRGALIGMSVIAMFFFARASGGQRIAVLVAVPILAAILVTVAPATALARLGTLFVDDAKVTGELGEAAESMASRSYLLQKSIEFTLEHPLLGVGPSQFATYEGLASRALGQHGNWHETHNTWTQISSECGLPAMIFVLASLFSVFRLVSKVARRAKAAGNKEIVTMCTCYMASLLAYSVSSTFLANGYRFTWPAMVSLGIAMHYAAEQELPMQRAGRP